MSHKIISNILSFASNKGADSLTISAHPGSITLDCRLKDGETVTIAVPSKLEQDFLSVLKRLLNLAPGELVSNRPGKLQHPKFSFDFHLTVRAEKDGEKIVLSLNDDQLQSWRLSQLGFGAAQLKLIRSLGARPGLIAVASLANQGKSATLAALLSEFNDSSSSIYWLHPKNSKVSCAVPGVNYLSANPDYWDKILSHDSDIIFADDADNDLSIEKALRAAQSGRRVFIAFTASDLKEAKAKISTIAQNRGLDRQSLKAVIYQSLADWPKPARGGRLRQRSKIGRFKVWSA